MKEKGVFISKKRLIAVLCIALASILLIYGAFAVLPGLFEDDPDDLGEFIPPRANFNFYTPDYDEDIFEDKDYLRLIENGIFEYDDGALISMIDKDNADGYGEPVELVVKMLYSIIEGDADEYNSYFSDKYFEKRSPKERFTMQKLYDGRITYFGNEAVEENGKQYTEYTFKLTYRIFKNNGTFRDDIGEGYRLQHVTVSDRGGKLQIDALNFVKYK
jgi:hypothetical protein